MSDQPMSSGKSWLVPTALVLLLLANIAYFATILLGHSYPCDYEVYRLAGDALRKGLPIYDTVTQGCDLKFTYTPFAAGIFAVMSIFGNAGFWIWTILSIVALWRIVLLLVRSSNLSLVACTEFQLVAGITLLLLPLEPFVKTLWYGQINIIIVWLVVESFLGPQRNLSGMFSAIATGIKLTPGLFSLFLVIVRGRRVVTIGALSLLSTVVIGFLLQPDQAKEYWTKLIFATDRVGPLEYLYNQSFNGMLWRIFGPTYDSPVLQLVIVVISVLVALWLARALWIQNLHLWALSVIGLVTLFVSPVSWSHHYVSFAIVIVALASDCRKYVSARVVLGVTYLWLLAGNITFRMMPKGGHREFAYTGWQFIMANQYVYLTIALLGFSAYRLTLSRTVDFTKCVG